MKTSHFFQQAACQIVLALAIISCKSYVEPLYEVKYHNDIFGIFQTPDGGFLLMLSRVNVTSSNCSRKCVSLMASSFGDICLIKTDANGAVLWEKVVEEKSDDVQMTARIAPDGNLLIAGNTGGHGMSSNGFIAKFNLEGVLLWKKMFELSPRAFYNASFSISAEGTMVRCIRLPNTSRYGFKVFDARGDTQWQYAPLATIEGELVDAVCLDNGEIMAFYPKLVQKFDKGGALLWSRPVDWSAEYVEQAKEGGSWVKWGNKIGKINNNGEMTASIELTMTNWRIIHFASNPSGDLLIQAKSVDGSGALHYALIDKAGHLKVNERVNSKHIQPTSGHGFNNPKFSQILPDKSTLLVEREDIYDSKDSYYVCQLRLSKFSEGRTLLWTTTIGKGRRNILGGNYDGVK